MFKIYKGGDTFFQWDIGQRLVVEDADMDKVHFCNKTKDCSLVCDVYEDAESGLRLVNVPNILLQDTFTIRAFGCLVEGENIYFAKNVQVFKVIARTKPEDYVYTEEELKNWSTMEEKIAELEAQLDEAERKAEEANAAINSALGELEENKLEALDVLANKESEALTAIGTKETDALIAIGNAQTSAVTEISVKRAEAVNDIASDKAEALEAIDAAENTALDSVAAEAEKVSGYATTAQTAADRAEDALEAVFASGYTTPQMFGAKADGVTDDTAAIQAALDASSYVYIPDGTYMINVGGGDSEALGRNGGIRPKSGQVIELAENAVLKAIPSPYKHYSLISLYEVDNVRITGGKVFGDRFEHLATGGDGGYGIGMWRATNIVVENMEVADCWGDSIFIRFLNYKDENGQTYGEPCKNIIISNCVLHGSRRQGISVIGAVGLTVRDCEIYDITEVAPKTGIDIEPDWVGSAYVENVLIENCYIHDTASSAIVTGGACPKNNIKIVGCVTTSGLNFLDGTNISVSDCTFSSIKFACADYVRVTNSKGNRILITGGNGTLVNCDFENRESDTCIINGTNDYIDTKRSELVSFVGCRFKTLHNTAGHFMNFAGAAASYTYHPDTAIHFKDCYFDFDEATSFTNRMPGRELQIIDCDFNFKKALTYQLFSVANKEALRIKIHGSTFKTADTTNITQLIKGTPPEGTTLELDLVNNVFPNATNLLYCSNPCSGTVRLLNNIMSSSKLNGTNSLTVFDANKPLVEVDYNALLSKIQELSDRVTVLEIGSLPVLLDLNRTHSTTNNPMDETTYINPSPYTSFNVASNPTLCGIADQTSDSITVTENGKGGGAGVAFPFIIYDTEQGVDRRGKSYLLMWNATGTTNTRFRLMMYDGSTCTNNNLDYKNGTLTSATIEISADGKTITVNGTANTFTNVVKCIAFHFSSATNTTTSYTGVKLIEQ